MAETCLSFQCNHVEGFGNTNKKRIQKLKESGESGDEQMKRERGKRRKKKK